ncbi:hypothetical protein ANCDUO_14445 [Ancylostoma duodenale]|uniref:Uncharacterized protein n=1 Tax=Ancylostoma duodenale TaxID=51022 RepID=A0A0C2D048_9BILA|nr:hypothetical protein ANCDUO_14445 [Ancylostoma duodenale]
MVVVYPNAFSLIIMFWLECGHILICSCYTNRNKSASVFFVMRPWRMKTSLMMMVQPLSQMKMRKRNLLRRSQIKTNHSGRQKTTTVTAM